VSNFANTGRHPSRQRPPAQRAAEVIELSRSSCGHGITCSRLPHTWCRAR
jgi:hypothetical protein